MKSIFPELPDELSNATGSALLKTFGTVDVTDTMLLKGGLSGSFVYKFKSGGRCYVMKSGPPSSAVEGKQSVLELVSVSGVGPKVFFDDPSSGVSISAFIENRPLLSVLTHAQLVSKLADNLRKTHLIAPVSSRKNIFETVDHLINSFNAANLLGGPMFDGVLGNYGLLKMKYPTNLGQVFSHNDLNPNNILFDGEDIWFIDWDAAGMNDRYVDLANTANFFVHNEQQEHLFLETYFQREATDRDRAFLYVMRPVCKLVYSLLMFQLALSKHAVQVPVTLGYEDEGTGSFGSLMASGQVNLTEPAGQLLYAKVLMKAADALFNDARFSAALTLI